MHRRTYQHNYKAAAILGIVSAIGFVALLPSPHASALATPSVNITIGNPLYDNGVNDLVLAPSSSNGSNYASYEVPVYIDTAGTEDFNIFIRSSNELEDTATKNNTWSEEYYNTDGYSTSTTTANLTGKKDGNTSTIKSLANLAGYDDTTGITKDNFRNLSTSTWGYRWIFSEDNKATRPTTISNTDKASIRSSLDATNFYGIKPGGSLTQLENSATSTRPATDPLRGSYITNPDHTYSGRLVLQFAASVTPDLPADEYTGYVAVSVVATPYKATLFDIETMQDMGRYTDICANTPTPAVNASGSIANKWGYYNGPTQSDLELHNDKDFYIGTPNNTNGTISYADTTKSNYESLLATYKSNPSTGFPYVPETILRDERDNKTYLIRKLADNNCWMSQNLELDFLTSSGGYAEYGSVGAESYNPSTGQYGGIEARTGIEFTPSDTDTTEVWNATKLPGGAKIYATTTSMALAGEVGAPLANNNYLWEGNGADGLRSYSFYGSTSLGAEQTFAKREGVNTDGFNNFVPTNNGGEPYSRRGNLYNGTSAYLGLNLESLNNVSETRSICPAGWRLPTSSTWPFMSFYVNGTYGATTDLNVKTDIYNKLTNFPVNLAPTGFRTSANDTIYYSRTASYLIGAMLTVAANESIVATEPVWYATYDVYAIWHNSILSTGMPIRCVAR